VSSDEWADENGNPMFDSERTKPVGIDNTTRGMQEDPAEGLLFLAAAMAEADGRGGSPIVAMEKRGQQQLVNSDRLPSDLKGDRAEWDALGFTFGDPDPDDPLFMPATLPEGWKREPADHDMWSYVTDQHGRHRVEVFYKAAFYDRSAFMRLSSLWSYVQAHVEDGEPLLIDGEWATRDTVIAAMRGHVAEGRKDAADFRGYAADPGRDEDNRRYFSGRIAETEATAAKYEAAIAALEAGQT
jgi:hypothetical protein